MAKRTPERVALAKRLRAEGRSFAEVAEMVSKGGRPVTEGAIRHWLRGESAEGPRVVGHHPAAAATPAARPADSLDPEPADIGPEELRALLAGELRRHQAEAERAMADNRPGDARQSSRLVAAFTAQLQRIHARQDEDVETVRVRAADMQGAADEAMAMLSQTADRVAAERASWPRCSGCGQPVGAFGGGDSSPVRALFERACRA